MQEVVSVLLRLEDELDEGLACGQAELEQGEDALGL